MSFISKSKVFAYLLALISVIGFVLFVIFRQTGQFNLEVILPYRKMLFSSFFNTIIVSMITLFSSLIVGFIFYLLSISKIKYFNAIVEIFTEIVYGTPLLVLVVVTAFLIGPAFGSYNRNFLGILSLILYMAPYMKNVFKSAIASIDEEQYLVIEVFGFTKYQKYRYIIFPQILRVLMPPLMNNLSLVIKGSALLNVLSYNELFYTTAVIQSRTYAFVEGYIVMWMLYLIITIPLSNLAKFIERKWATI
ncbi:MAG: ABC transporter permease subunit [Acholeplasmataceae bacterium]|nr:ABC transporter permease subunit [Acholeplasmataceae bacterium]